VDGIGDHTQPHPRRHAGGELAELIVEMGVTRRHPQRLHSLRRFYQTDMARQKCRNVASIDLVHVTLHHDQICA
jgi:hypothetical protein